VAEDWLNGDNFLLYPAIEIAADRFAEGGTVLGREQMALMEWGSLVWTRSNCAKPFSLEGDSGHMYFKQLALNSGPKAHSNSESEITIEELPQANHQADTNSHQTGIYSAQADSRLTRGVDERQG
jgi:hypothetical protein